MKIRNIAKFGLVWLLLGLGLPAIQSARGQSYTNTGALFQFAIFYNGLMEFTDCAPLTNNGPVQCNSNIYVGCPPGSFLSFNSPVTCSGIITNPSWFGYAQSSYIIGNITYNGTPAPGYATGTPVLTLPMPITNSLAQIIQLPNASDSATNPLSLQRYYYKANLVILVTNITTSITGTVSTSVVTSVTLNSSMFDPAPLTVSYTNYASSAFTNAAISNEVYQMNTNWAWWFGSTNSLTNNQASWLTINTTFYDARQGQTNQVTQINVTNFGTWIATNTNCLAKWNPTTPFNGIIYVADMRTTNGMYMDCVRLTNGLVIPTNAATYITTGPGSYTSNYSYAIPGFTVATINPLYIEGNYNCPNYYNLASTNTGGTQPCSVVCDALTILSSAWEDSTSFGVTSNDIPTAATSDTVNTAIIAGNVPSTGSSATQFSGGVHNLTRLLENWSSSALWLNTSLVNLYASSQATRQFQTPGVYYNAPVRHISYDQNFNSVSMLPPGTPQYNKVSATVILSNLNQVYNGTPRNVTVTTVPAGLTAPATYSPLGFWGGPVTNAPTIVGPTDVTAIINDPIYTGYATNVLVISKATAAVMLTNLAQTYNGSARNVSVTTSPANLTVTMTYNGSNIAPTNAGSYTVIATVNDYNYQGIVTNTLVINPAPATISLSNLSQTYTGSAESATVTTTPVGLGVNVTYNGSANLPVNTGSYTVVAGINNPNYQATPVTNTLVISQANALVSLNNLLQTYTGSPESVGVTTVPGGLNVAITYNGGLSAPTNAGSYLVAGTVVDPNYQGSDVETLVITQAAAPLTFSNLTQNYDGTAKSVLPITDPSNLLVNITYDGLTNAPTNIGSYFVAGAIVDPNYQGSATNTLVISQGVAGITFSNLLQVFSGAAESVSVTTVPPGLMVNVTYNGATNAPTNTGSYSVVATVNDTNYQGSETNTLVIVPPATTPIMLGGSTVLADGTFQLSFTNTPGASFSVLGSADPTAPVADWTVLGSAVEVSPGQFQFIDLDATNQSLQFYMISSP